MGTINRILNGEVLSWPLIKMLPQNGLCVIAGGLGSGKTCLGYGILEVMHYFNPEKPVIAYGFPKEKSDILPDWVQVSNTQEFPDESIVVADEAHIAFHSRESMNKKSRQLDKFLALLRQKNIFGIFISQTFRRLDIGVLTTAQLVLIKKVPLLQVQLDRSQMKKKLETVAEGFKKARKRGYDPVKCVYFISNYHDSEGLLYNSNFEPTFWTDDISRGWSNVSMQNKK